MSSMFEKAMDRADRIIAQRLNDQGGRYVGADGQRTDCLELMIDRSIELGGALEMFPAGQVVVTVLKEQLSGNHVQRGGMFELDGIRHLVQETIKDDGAFISYLCMESA